MTPHARKLDILGEVLTEQERAEQKWGYKFDEKNNANDWAAYILAYVSRALNVPFAFDKQIYRVAMIKAAGLCLSAIYWCDTDKMPPRHYD